MKPLTKAILSIISALLLSAILAALFPRGSFWVGWLSGSGLLALGFYALLSAWHAAGGGKLLAWMVALAFLLRLIAGSAVSLGLPVYGYTQEPEQKAGYLFADAYSRDTQAWQLAKADKPILTAFGEQFSSDQYGGLLALSALVYRVLSPDAHRPYLILILAAFTFAVGVPFFYRAVRERWGAPVAALAAWILVLYPDGILFSSSQMREPFLIGLLCILFWAVVSWPRLSTRKFALISVAGLAGMALISSRVVLPAAGALAVLFFLEHSYERVPGRWKLAVWGAFALAGVGVIGLTGEWFASAVKWDLFLSSKYSGFSLKAIKEIGNIFAPVFYTVYGMARPVLPAAIGGLAAERVPWIWKTIDMFRSLGWYALAPLVVYSFLAVWKAHPEKERRVLLWLVAVALAWLVISSARAGGDQWDNPRYRTIFLPFLALLAGWGLRYAIEQRCVWFPRLLAVEGIFIVFFTQWYLSRYWTWLVLKRLPFWSYPLWIIALSAVVLLGGLLWDRAHARSKASPTVLKKTSE